MPSFIFKLHRSARAALPVVLFIGALAIAPAAGAADIEDHTEVMAEQVTRMSSLLMVGTSGLHGNRDLGNKQALIGAEVRKLIKARGVEVTPIGIRPEDSMPQATIDDAIAKHAPSHTLHITVPQGTVFVSRLTGRQIAAKDYVVRAEIVNARTHALIWEYMADVQAVLGASNAQVAESIVARMAKDGLL